MNGLNDLIARHEAMLTSDRRPRFVLRAIPENLEAIRITKSREEARWIADRMIQLDIFAPGLKNYDLLPDADRGNFYYFFMGEADSPISFVKMLENGVFIYGAPAYTPIGFDIYPEMLLAYIVDFLSACSDLYRHSNYQAAFRVQIELQNVEGLSAKISQRTEWHPIAPAQLLIQEDVAIAEVFPSPGAIRVEQVRRLLNRFFSQIGLSGRSEDAPLPRDFESQLLRLR